MPSTVGHVIAGAAIAWASDIAGGTSVRRPVLDARGGHAPGRPLELLRPRGLLEPLGPLGPLGPMWRLTLICAAVAAAPDLDLLLRTHRTYTHSIGATLCVGLFAAAMAAYAQLPVARVALVCATAHASHILLDWLAADRTLPYGIEALWPLSQQFYISGLDLFRQTERRHFFTGAAIRANTLAVAQELLILGPLAWAVWLVRIKALAGLATEVSSRDHATQ